MSTNTALRVAREYGDTIPVELLGSADATRIDSYYRPITEDERACHNQDIADLTVKITDVEEEKKASNKSFAEDIKAKKAARSVSVKVVKSGQVEVVDTIHTYMDYDRLMVYEYNTQGHITGSRRMTPKERQMKIQ